MIITARQLEDLHKSHGGNGRVTLPYRARLTPLASDFVRARKLVVGYSDIAPNTVPNGAQGGASNGTPVAIAQEAEASLAISRPEAATANAGFLWWCDGPCGPAKAALVQEEKQSPLRPLDKPADGRQVAGAIKAIAGEVKAGRASGAVLLVQSAAAAVVFANRCPSLRAILGTCLEAVEQGVQLVGANVLIIEYPHKTLQQVKNMLSRFLRSRPAMSQDVRRQLEELASCG